MTDPNLQGSEVVLVVDDDQPIRDLIGRVLRKHGYYVLEAVDGEDALRVLQEHHEPVHLVISDVVMPEMQGTELVGMLRSWFPQMRVLFMSGHSEEYLNVQGDMLEGSAFLPKPFTLEALALRVRALLDADWSERLD